MRIKREVVVRERVSCLWIVEAIWGEWARLMIGAGFGRSGVCFGEVCVCTLSTGLSLPSSFSDHREMAMVAMGGWAGARSRRLMNDDGGSFCFFMISIS